jgi:hypothetical protein
VLRKTNSSHIIEQKNSFLIFKIEWKIKKIQIKIAVAATDAAPLKRKEIFGREYFLS